MLFNSLPFLIFLPAVLLLYSILPKAKRWILLLFASYLFYGFWRIEYLSLIVISTVVDYSAGRFMHTETNSLKRKLALITSLTVNLGLLFLFKYSNWFIDDVLFPVGLVAADGLPEIHEALNFILPVGISFYTFQTIGYSIDVYHREVLPERNPFKFALFVSFFPQLVAGPIERFKSLHAQLFQGTSINYGNFRHGFQLILYGLFIKMCVADNISPIVEVIFAQNLEASIAQRLIGMGLFAAQIFSDFHGYSLIAIGTAQLFGITLMDNFKSPYLSLSIREFWSRWHISLSTWFRDYLYIPLGGNRASKLKVTLNILIVFIVSGFWHGANWTFIIWGAIHGCAYLIEQYSWNSQRLQSIIPGFVRWAITLGIVLVAWVFFRASNLEHALAFLDFSQAGNGISIEWNTLGIGFLCLFLWSDSVFGQVGFHKWIDSKSIIIRWVVYLSLLYFITGFAGTTNHPFIYFQF